MPIVRVGGRQERLHLRRDHQLGRLAGGWCGSGAVGRCAIVHDGIRGRSGDLDFLNTRARWRTVAHSHAPAWHSRGRGFDSLRLHSALRALGAPTSQPRTLPEHVALGACPWCADAPRARPKSESGRPDEPATRRLPGTGTEPGVLVARSSSAISRAESSRDVCATIHPARGGVYARRRLCIATRGSSVGPRPSRRGDPWLASSAESSLPCCSRR
jgi:hypothetical protein